METSAKHISHLINRSDLHQIWRKDSYRRVGLKALLRSQSKGTPGGSDSLQEIRSGWAAQESAQVIDGMSTVAMTSAR